MHLVKESVGVSLVSDFESHGSLFSDLWLGDIKEVIYILQSLVRPVIKWIKR